jgi:hypothetical protein
VPTDDDEGGFEDSHTIADPDSARRIVEYERRTRTEEAMKTLFKDMAGEPVERQRTTAAAPVVIEAQLAPPSAARSQTGMRSTKTALRTVDSRQGLSPKVLMFGVAALVAAAMAAGGYLFLLR